MPMLRASVLHVLEDWAGLMISALAALQWDDVDAEEQRVIAELLASLERLHAKLRPLVKRPYHSPELRELGTIGDLTKGMGGGSPEGMSGATKPSGT